jgi:predicted nucleic acid-binding protein
MRSAVDTNVLSAIWDQEPNAAQLSQLLDQSLRAGSVAICGVVYAETLAHPRATESFVREFLRDTGIVVDFDLDEEVWLAAGRGFARYAERRRRSVAKQQPRRILADFLIGAHAMLTADRLITLDRARYQRDFPQLKLV